jgi:hypothetical protein
MLINFFKDLVDVTYGYDVTDTFVDDTEAVCSIIQFYISTAAHS